MSLTSNDVRLRLATTPTDEHALVEFMRQLREDDPEEGALDEVRSRPAMWRLLLEPSLGRVWMIEVDGHPSPAGYVALTLGFSIEFGGVVGVVDELFVARDRRGGGVGSRALQRVIDQARSMDVVVMFLEVTRSNDVARRVYAKAGFVPRPHQTMSLMLT